MAYKKGLPRPNIESRFLQIVVLGKPLDTVLKIKDEHKKTDKQTKHRSKGEICNRMITDYIDMCADCRLKPLFELPYNVHECIKYNKYVLPGGTTLYVEDKKVVKSLSMHIYLNGKALALVNQAQEMLRSHKAPSGVERVVNYFLERLQAFVDQREMDYITFYKQKYRL